MREAEFELLALEAEFEFLAPEAAQRAVEAVEELVSGALVPAKNPDR